MPFQAMRFRSGAVIPTGPWAKWSTTDKSSLITVSDSDRLATASSGALTVRSIRATHALPAGKSYFEILLQVFTASNLTLGLGLSNASLNVSTQYAGQLASSWAIWGQYLTTSNRKYTNATATGSFAGQFLTNVVVGFATDMSVGHLWMAVNNAYIEGNPAAGTGASYTNLSGNGPLFPTASIYTLNDAMRLRANPAEMTYAPPAGFTAGIPG